MDGYRPLNIVLVGDSKVGKSALISTCHIQNTTLDENGFLWYKRPSEAPTTYSPTSFKSHRTDILLRGYYSTPYKNRRVFQTCIIEIGGSRRHDQVRPLAYMNCDVFLLCFDLTNRASLENVQSKWIPEIRHYEPQTPMILLGSKADLKTERQVMAGKEVHKLLKTLGMDRYIEISCHDDENVYALFSTAVELAYEYKKKKSESLQEEVIKFDVNELDSISDPPVFTKKDSTTLCDDWQETLNNNRLTDIILKFPGNSQDVHAHKFVLSLASGAFKKLLRDMTSCKKNILGRSLQSSKIEEPLGTSSSKGSYMYSCEKCKRNSCSCVPKGDKFLAGMAPFEQEQEFSKNFTNRATNFSCKADCHKLEITFDASVDYTAFACILKWMYTGILDIPEKLDDSFVENLYHVVLELEIHPLKVLCHHHFIHKAKGRDLRQKRAMSTGQETLQADGNPAPLQEHQGNENSDQEDEEAQNMTTVQKPPVIEFFEIFMKRKIVFVPVPPSLESFESYINQKKKSYTTSNHSHCSTDKTKAENAKIDAIIAHKEMWRRADKLLAEDDWLTDTELVVEDTPISVHRLVMATRSPMLAAMLEGGFKEREHREIRLPGICLEHFHTFLEFLYTDKCLLDKDNLRGILELADRFCIQSLIDRCEEFLLWTFSTYMYDYTTLAAHHKEQVGSIMEGICLSKTYNAPFLHKWCLHHVATNYSFFEEEEDFETVWAENEEFMEQNRWPSRKCSQLLKSYKDKSRQKEIVSNVPGSNDSHCRPKAKMEGRKRPMQAGNSKCCVM